MSKWYGHDAYSIVKTKKLIKVLFGEESKRLPNLYVPFNLDYLVAAINLPQSSFFGSYINIIEKMSVFPLYTYFMSDNILGEYEIFRNINSFQLIEHKFKLRGKVLSYSEGEPRLKFCKCCLLEDNLKFLNREHQIQDNFICYKHNQRLQYIEYDSMKSYNLNIDYEKVCFDSKYCITEDDKFLDLRKQIAKTIHKILSDKLIDTRVIIKSKLRKRLRELGYMRFNYFVDIDQFLNDFKSFNLLQLNNKQLHHMIYTTSIEEAPISYISLVLFLFRSIECFNKYSLLSDEIVDIKYSSTEYKHLFKSSYGERVLEEYNILFEKYHGDKYRAIAIKEDMLIVKHKLCGDITSYPKKSFKWFKTCQECHKIEINNKYKHKVEQINTNYEFLEVDTIKQSLKLRHIECNREFEIMYDSFKKGLGCQYCKNLHNYRKRVNDVFEDEYLVLDYSTYLKDATYVHNKKSCKGKFKIPPKQFIKLRYCPSCHSSKTYKEKNMIVYNHNK